MARVSSGNSERAASASARDQPRPSRSAVQANSTTTGESADLADDVYGRRGAPIPGGVGWARRGYGPLNTWRHPRFLAISLSWWMAGNRVPSLPID